MTNDFKEKLFLMVTNALIANTQDVASLKAPQRETLANQAIKLTESLFSKYQTHEQKLFTENYKEED